MGRKAEQERVYRQASTRRRWKAKTPAEMRIKLKLVGVMSLDTMIACLSALNADKRMKVNHNKTY